ncbi:hypothetical protein HY971_03855 [Candidatus Kaiserbacteria bacterium]|nr:hypothetical protein [Candidatus Kaiserbacteria bacterium]
MQSSNARITLLFALSVAGLLFSGYLSAVKFFSEVCALNEQCPYFLGYPACYFGFAMYLTMTILTAQFFLGGLTRSVALNALKVVSGAGIIFAGYFTLQELPRLFAGGLSAYVLGLPTCAYGLLVYIAIFCIAFAAHRE